MVKEIYKNLKILTLERGMYFKHSFLSKSHDEGLGTACIYFFTWQVLT